MATAAPQSPQVGLRDEGGPGDDLADARAAARVGPDLTGAARRSPESGLDPRTLAVALPAASTLVTSTLVTSALVTSAFATPTLVTPTFVTMAVGSVVVARLPGHVGGFAPRRSGAHSRSRNAS